MIMSTISGYDQALDFFPEATPRPTAASRFVARLRLLWEAMGEANAAAYRYRQLTAHGLTADAAASQVFTEFYAPR
jgi:hypothetical protein